MPEIAARRAVFRTLHRSGCFVIPNPWDVGSARFLASLGFPALATTSSGFSFSIGRPDMDWAVTRDEALAHIGAIVEATDLPVNADYESGFAHEPDRVADNVRLCVETGIAGLSIEDATGDPARPLYELPLAVERIRAARAAIDASGTGVLLTGRAEPFLVGHSDPLREARRRIEAYAEAGADVLYAPGVGTAEQIAAIVEAAAGKPINVLASSPSGLDVAALADLGVRRVSLGSALARAAWGGFARAARDLAQRGRFDALDEAMPFAELNGFFRDGMKRRGGR